MGGNSFKLAVSNFESSILHVDELGDCHSLPVHSSDGSFLSASTVDTGRVLESAAIFLKMGRVCCWINCITKKASFASSCCFFSNPRNVSIVVNLNAPASTRGCLMKLRAFTVSGRGTILKMADSTDSDSDNDRTADVVADGGKTWFGCVVFQYTE